MEYESYEVEPEFNDEDDAYLTLCGEEI